MKTILVHINAEVPEDSGITAKQVEDEVGAALEVATEGGNCPGLAAAEVVIAMAEEVYV